MVVRTIIYLFMLIPTCLFAAEFTASVNRNQIAPGESFTLDLTLKDASAKDAPSTSPLKKSFMIHSRHQSSNTMIINGKYSSSTTWQYTLLPQKEGELTIPSMSINTSEGTLTSEPIEIRVAKRTGSSGSDSSEYSGIMLKRRVSKDNPYKDEPITYSVKLISEQDLANIRVQKISIEDAIVEATGKPQVDERIIDGIQVKIIEFKYIITPLKAGALTIPPTTIQGDIPVRRQARLGSFLNDGFDSFSMMRHFDRLEPFALSTDETVLEVQPPIADVIPWLPAISLKIEETWDDNQSLKVGEPLTRSFRILAEGVKASQLPSLNDQQLSDNAFKIYADKPEMDEQVKNGILKSFRNEQYTLIPQQSGMLTLPKITVSWWDVTNNTIAYTRVPSRTLEILPAPENNLNREFPPTVAESNAINEPQGVVTQSNPLLYALIAGLAVLLLFAFFWGITLRKKIARLTDTPVRDDTKRFQKPLPVHLKELETIATAKQLQQFLQSYAHQKWKIPKNATLKNIFDSTKKNCPQNLNSEITSIEKTLEDALYQNKEIDINEIVQRCSIVLEQTTETTSTSVKKEKLPDLNPS